MKTIRLSAVACVVALGASAVSAETLTVEGVYAPNVAIPGDIEVIAMESFGGSVGSDIAIELTDVLSGVYIEGRPYFRVIPAATAGSTQVVVINSSEGTAQRVRVDDPNAPDAVMRGSVRLRADDRRISDRVRKECIAKDDRGKCVEREEIRTRCDEFSMRLNPRLQLIAADGTQLYSNRNERSESVRYCADEDVDIDPEAMAEAMVRELVAQVRADIAPRQRSEGIRIMESRKNLQRSDRDAFRSAVKLTNNDPNAACDAFEALEANNPTHVSVLFNIGLCYEQAGALVVAQDYYFRALESDPGRDYPTWGVDRIESRFRADEQLEARASSEG